MEERRKYIRVPLVIKVTNKGTREFHFFYSTDISQGGLFLESKDPYDLETEVELDFFISLKDRKEHMILTGKVVRVQPYDIRVTDGPTSGMGVEFTNMETKEIAVLSEYVRLSLG